MFNTDIEEKAFYAFAAVVLVIIIAWLILR